MGSFNCADAPVPAYRTRGAAIMLGLIAALAQTARAGGAAADIVDYFKLYYAQTVVKAGDADALEFLRDAAAHHDGPQQVLKPGAARSVVIDRRNGYLRLDDSSNTDQILTMASYSAADGSRLIVVGSSDCADACDFAVRLFVPDGDHLKPAARRPVVPAVSASQFIRAGRPMPKALAAIQPKINYVPARVGTGLTLKPWYGYEAEEQMDGAARSAIQDVELRWDRDQGIFVKAPAR
jgi:hypothetical protein